MNRQMDRLPSMIIRFSIVSILAGGLAACVPIPTDRDRQSNGASAYPPISYDGHYVAFFSLANNLVPNDTNNAGDIFVHDREAQTTTRVSVSSNGQEGDNESIWPSLSGDGRYVAFTSTASNLVPDDTNKFDDVFVHDRESGITQRVSISSAGDQSNEMSYSYFPSISRDGRYVAFLSRASNLVPDDDNSAFDVFVHDRETGTTSRASVDSKGQEANGDSLHAVISGNGRYVAFHSTATNLVIDDKNESEDVFVHDRETGITARVSVNSEGQEGNGVSDRAAISDNGLQVAFSSVASNLVPGDTNESEDVFAVSLGSTSSALVPRTITPVTVSSSGQLMAKDRTSPNLCCILSLVCCILDRKSVISPDGQNVVFRSDANNLVEADMNLYQDIFVHNLPSKTTIRVSVASNGGEANNISMHHGVSFDGRYVAFSSEATNLVADDTNGVSDIFVYDRETRTTTRVSVRSR